MKAYIMTVDPMWFPNKDDIKRQTDRCIQSCIDHGHEYEIIYGPTYKEKAKYWMDKWKWQATDYTGRLYCTISHGIAWERITKPSIVMEFDGYLKKKVDFEPDEKTLYWIHDHKRRLAHAQVITPYLASLFHKYMAMDTHPPGLPVDTFYDIASEIERRGNYQPWYKEFASSFSVKHVKDYASGNEYANNKKKSARKIVDEL